MHRAIPRGEGFGVALCATNLYLRQPQLPAMSSASLAAFQATSATRARATLVSLMQHYAPERVHAARQAPEHDIRGLIADAIETFGLAEATSWNIMGGSILQPASAGALAKAGPSPGRGEWAETFDVGNSARNLANAPAIPRELTIGVLLRQYVGDEAGQKARQRVAPL